MFLAPLWIQVVHLLAADTLWASLVVLTARLTLQPQAKQEQITNQIAMRYSVTADHWSCRLSAPYSLFPSLVPVLLSPARQPPHTCFHHDGLSTGNSGVDVSFSITPSRRITVSSALPPRMLGFQANA